jgi:hypothetical protein
MSSACHFAPVTVTRNYTNATASEAHLSTDHTGGASRIQRRGPGPVKRAPAHHHHREQAQHDPMTIVAVRCQNSQMARSSDG